MANDHCMVGRVTENSHMHTRRLGFLLTGGLSPMRGEGIVANLSAFYKVKRTTAQRRIGTAKDEETYHSANPTLTGKALPCYISNLANRIFQISQIQSVQKMRPAVARANMAVGGFDRGMGHVCPFNRTLDDLRAYGGFVEG